MDKKLDKKSEKKTEKPRKPLRQKWQNAQKVLSVDDRHVVIRNETGSITVWSINADMLRTQLYRELLVNQGHWIPSMDRGEHPYTVCDDESEDEDEVQGKMAEKEPFSERMRKLKVQQKDKFKKYYERKEAQRKKRNSQNSKSGVSKYEGDKKVVKTMEPAKKLEPKLLDARKIEPKKVKPKPRKSTNAEKIVKDPKLSDMKNEVVPLKLEPDEPKKVEPTPEESKPKEPLKVEYVVKDPKVTDAKNEVVPAKLDPKEPDEPKKAEPTPEKPKPKEPPVLKETVRSHYCYTEMHLTSGKEVKKK